MAAGSVVEPGRVGNGGETTRKARVWALSCICGSPKAWRVLGSGVRAGFESCLCQSPILVFQSGDGENLPPGLIVRSGAGAHSCLLVFL